jgi:hypothetical protein
VRAGSLVRLGLHDEPVPIEGVVSGMGPEAWEVTIPSGATRRVALSEVMSAQVQVTRRHTLRGTLIGGAVGLGGGLLLVATSDDDCDRDVTGICDAFVVVAETAALVWAPVAGAAVGALVGTLVTSRRWVPALVPGGSRGAVGLSWSLSSP